MAAMARQSAAVAGVRSDLASGQFFRAYDRARAALEAEGESPLLRLLEATALLSTGAVEEARATVARFDPLLDSLIPDRSELCAGPLLDDPECADLLVRIYRTSWRDLGDYDDLRRARDLQLARFRQTGGLVEGASAAVLCRCLGETALARDLAAACLRGREPKRPRRWRGLRPGPGCRRGRAAAGSARRGRPPARQGRRTGGAGAGPRRRRPAAPA